MDLDNPAPDSIEVYEDHLRQLDTRISLVTNQMLFVDANANPIEFQKFSLQLQGYNTARDLVIKQIESRKKATANSCLDIKIQNRLAQLATSKIKPLDDTNDKLEFWNSFLGLVKKHITSRTQRQFIFS